MCKHTEPDFWEGGSGGEVLHYFWILHRGRGFSMGYFHGEKLQSSCKASGGRQRLLEVGQPQTHPLLPLQPAPFHLPAPGKGEGISCAVRLG